MHNRWILGRAGSGKSEYCLNEVRTQLLQEPDGPPLLLIVPEQATFQTEHALITTPGLSGSIRGQVYNFPRLAWRIMQEIGGTARLPIDETGKVMLIQRLLHTQQDRWQAFGSSAEKLGFAKELLDLFTELKRQCISADALQQHQEACRDTVRGHTALLNHKLDEIQLLYSQYESELDKQYLDGDAFLEILADRLAESAWIREARLWVDGFFGFSPLERRVLTQCMRHCESVSITLCLDRPYSVGEQPHELDLFYSTAMTMIRVEEEAANLGIPKSEVLSLPAAGEMPRYRANPMLAHLERQYENRYSSRMKPYFSASTADKAGAESQSATEPTILLRPAANRKTEIEGTARRMLQLAAQGVRWREMTVMVRELAGYGDLIGNVFDNFGIPYFIDQKRAVLHHPIAEFIRAALEVVIKHWRYDAVFRAIKTDFFLPLEEIEQETHLLKPHDGEAAADSAADHIVTRDSMDELENYVLAYGINGSRWKEERAWQMTGRLSLEQEPSQVQSSWKDIRRAARISAARKRVLEPLNRFEHSFQKARTVRQRAEALYQLLIDVETPERLERWSRQCAEQGQPEKAREHSQMWELIMDLLDQLDEMMGDEDSKPEPFADLIDSGLDSIALGLVPPSLDQVLVGSIDRTRSTRVDYCFVLGVNDGILPARINRDGILSEQEREWLIESGLNLADSGRRKQLDEQLLIYSVLCVPSKQLWLSYPLADEEGRSLLPSEIIRQIKAMFPQLQEKLLTAEPDHALPAEEQLDFLVPEGQALTHLTVLVKQWMRGSSISPIWWLAYNELLKEPAWQQRVDTMLEALFFTNHEERLDPRISSELYGERLQASVSRMERFVACPFSQFASHGLRLRERQVYRLEAPDIGQLFHAALSGLLESLQQSGANWNDYPHEQLMKMTSDMVDSLTPRLQSEILLSSSRYRYIARKLKGIVGKAASILAEHGKRSEFVPVGLELGFGAGEALPPLSFELNNGNRMDIVGRIDRVDKADSEQGLLLRVIDYKSSRTGLYLPELFYGLSLQMLTYLDVVLTHSAAWLGQEAEPAGVLYFHVHNPLLRTNQPLDADTAQREALKRFKMKGLLLADEQAVRKMDTELKSGHSTIVPAALKADGSFYSSASVATGEQWGHLRKFVRRKIRDIGSDITSGNVAITPYRLGSKSACDFCPYQAVCQFDPLLEGNQFKALPRKSEEEIWQQINQVAATERITESKGGD